MLATDFNFKCQNMKRLDKNQKSEEEYRHDYAKCLDVIKTIKTEEHWITASKYIGLFSKKWNHFYKNEIPADLDVIARTEQLRNLLYSAEITKTPETQEQGNCLGLELEHCW